MLRDASSLRVLCARVGFHGDLPLGISLDAIRGPANLSQKASA
jgi:hypothetical protein